MKEIIIRTKCTTKGTNTYYKRTMKAIIGHYSSEDYALLPEITWYVPSKQTAKEVLREASPAFKVTVKVNKKEAMK